MATEEEKKAALAKERENIKVDIGRQTDDGKGDDIEDKDKDEKKDDVDGDAGKKDDEVDEKKDEKKEEKDDDEEDDDEKKELTEEEKVAKAAEKETKRQERINRKFEREVGRRKAVEAELADARKKLEAKGEEGETFTKEDIEKEAKKLADQKLADDAFNKAVKKLAKDGEKADKDFIKKINALADDIGAIPGQMIGILEDIDNGGEILAYLANHEDEAEEVWELAKNPVKLGIRLLKLSDKLEKEKKKKDTKEVSKVPAPNEPIGGGRQSTVVLHDKMSDKEWIEKRNQQVAEKNRQKREAMRG